MHTALMEASMDGHVEVAKLLLDSGAQVRVRLLFLVVTKSVLYVCDG
jgi:ankyrin repeat protein